MKIVNIDFAQIITIIILCVGWATGNLNGWIVFAMFFSMCEFKYKI